MCGKAYKPNTRLFTQKNKALGGKKMQLGISTWVYVARPIEEAAPRIRGAGIRLVELWGDTPTHLDPVTRPRERAEEVAAVLQALDMKPVSLHAPFSGFDLSSPDKTQRTASVNAVLRSVEFCRNVRCPHIVVHVSASPGVKSQAALDRRREYAVDALQAITESTKKNGVEVLLENMVIHPNYLRLGSEVEALLDLVARFSGEGVSICIDTGHSFLNKQNPSEDIRKAGKHLRSLHINDNDGVRDRHWVPGRGGIDWPAVSSALREVKYGGVFLLEIYGFDVVRETIGRATAFSRSLLGR
jgi:sugar phosphate isomerase/epimerase